MLIKNPLPSYSYRYTKNNIKAIYWSDRLSTGIYISEKLCYNLKTGNITFSSYFYISPYYRDKWHSYSEKRNKKKREMKEHKITDKQDYQKRNMRRICFNEYMGYRTFLREAIVYNTRTGVVSYTSFFELKKSE